MKYKTRLIFMKTVNLVKKFKNPMKNRQDMKTFHWDKHIQILLLWQICIQLLHYYKLCSLLGEKKDLFMAWWLITNVELTDSKPTDTQTFGDHWFWGL